MIGRLTFGTQREPIHGALACVIGTMDLVRPLGLAGIRCAVVANAGGATRYSRFTRHVIEWADPWKEPEVLLERLMTFGRRQPEPPVLYYEGDWDLLLVSRHRDQLREAFRFVVPEAELVEDLVDKARFEALARRLDLSVPPSQHLRPAEMSEDEHHLDFPVILKPLTRQIETWRPISGGPKAVQVDSLEQLRALWPRLAQADVEVLSQELVPGPETLIESYHAYVDDDGAVVAEFTGRKVRTYPAEYGFSTALEITDQPDVVRLGRDILERLAFRGVVKFDFKRDRQHRLLLLECNPRFNLWHHLGAVAGVNLPALVYQDLVGLSRRSLGTARAGARWCFHAHDARAARAAGIPFYRWLPWALSSDAKSVFALDDPMPMVRGSVALAGKALRSRLRPKEA